MDALDTPKSVVPVHEWATMPIPEGADSWQGPLTPFGQRYFDDYNRPRYLANLMGREFDVAVQATPVIDVTPKEAA